MTKRYERAFTNKGHSIAEVIENDCDSSGGGPLLGRKPGGRNGRGRGEDHDSRDAVQNGANVAHPRGQPHVFTKSLRMTDYFEFLHSEKGDAGGYGSD